MKESEKLYNQIKKMSYEEFSSLFQSAEELFKNNNFDWTSLLYRNANKKDKQKQIIKNITDMSMDLFSSKNLEKVSKEKNQQNIETLQKLFFFYLKNIAVQAGDSQAVKLCEEVQKSENWKSAKNQCEILNLLIKNTVSFNKYVPVTEDEVDFFKLQDGAFPALMSITKLLYYFSGTITKEDVINELNFVREQQKHILQCVPNWGKTYTEAEAEKEIETLNKNIKILREIDSGFEVKNFGQTLFKENQNLKIEFNRKLECKVFRETDNVWITKPHYDLKKRKITGEKSERAGNKNALYKKYLYPERNVFTHSGENSAVNGYFNTHPRDADKWKAENLQALFDIRDYLRKNSGQQISDRLTSMVNAYFEKIVSKVQFSPEPETNAELWNAVFDEKGNLKLKGKQLKKINIYDSLDDMEIEQLKGLLRFMYCSSHENDDFIEKNKLTIVLYLTVVSLKITLRMKQ